MRKSVERLFASLERECGVRGRWMHRRDDPTTYMEVYEDVKDEARFETVLEREGAVVLERTIDVHVKTLRRKLGGEGDYIETVRGIGYRFKE